MRAQLSQLKQNRRNAASCRLVLGQLMPDPFPAAQPALVKPTPGQPTLGQPAVGQPANAQLALGTAAGQAPV